MWFRKLRPHSDSLARGGVATATRRSKTFGPRAVEALENRALMSHISHHPILPQPHPFTRNYTETNLVTDKMRQVTGNPVIDSNLVNPWGIAFSTISPFWVADNGKGLATLYNGSGTKQSLEVTIPLPAGVTSPSPSAPTGTVFNTDTTHFVVTENGKSGASVFIFATEDGTISGWNPTVDGTHAILKKDNSSSGAVYKGLAQASINGATFLYATNFRSGNVDVFDNSFNPVTLASGAFTDSRIPNGFAPFGIQTINGNLYVTYAKQDAAHHDDVEGKGNGFVDVYDPNGKLLQRVAARGTLNSPWGLAVDPAGFGRFSGALLVGNFGDSRINAFDLKHGTFLGQLTGTNGKPLVLNGGIKETNLKGLWGIAFDNGVPKGNTNTLYFTAGINAEADGLFGNVMPAST